MKDLKEKLKDYLDSNLSNQRPKRFSSFNKTKCFSRECFSKEKGYSVGATYRKKHIDTEQIQDLNIKDFLDKHEEDINFQTMLFKLIDDRNLKDSDVYNKVHIDRRLFSKIRSDENYHPSKETIILLALALELTENELDSLLDSASYSLPKNNKYDLIIRFCFINKILKLTDVNELLYEYNCKQFKKM